MSRVLRANIPVNNGVIHLIEKPLMIIDTSIGNILRREKSGRLTIFNKLVDKVREVKVEIMSREHKTILAPTDLAFLKLDENYDNIFEIYLESNITELADLLLHIVTQWLLFMI